MICNRTMTRSDGQVYRSGRDRVFAGVCGGLADHFGVSSTWLRVGFILGTIISSGTVAPFLYVMCIFLLPRDGVVMTRRERRAARRASKVVPPPIPRTHRSREEAYDHLRHQLDLIEGKIRIMEDHVTSKEYVLKRKFEDL